MGRDGTGDSKITISRSIVICVIAAIVMSMVMVLERHYSLMDARRDHQAMQRRLEALNAEVEQLGGGLVQKGRSRGWKEGAASAEVAPKEGDEEGPCRWCELELAACKAQVTGITSSGKNQTGGCEADVASARRELELKLAGTNLTIPDTPSETCGGGNGTALLEELKHLKSEMTRLQTAYNKQEEEKLKMAQTMIECETSSKWNESVLTPRAVDAAKEAVAKCGQAFHGTGKDGAPTPAAKLYSCEATDDELARYLNYTARSACPDDWHFVQNLIFVKNCYCLPKRACFARTAADPSEPLPLPQSLWDVKALKDESVRWSLHSYDSFNAINTRKLGDCKNCFNLTLEETRWKRRRHGTILLDDVVKMKKGALRIGLDAGGGTGSFAAKMAAHNVTILTTAMNVETIWDDNGGLPYMETIALRGLVPLHLPHKARLPFFDNTLDIIHTINSIKYFTLAEFEELIFDWDRVLRPGGIIWLEWFYTPASEMPLYVAILDLFKFHKLYWNMSPKADSGERSGEHMYLNCVLEKPARP